MTFTYGDITVDCARAVRSADSIVLLDKDGKEIAMFGGITDFAGYVLEGGEWSAPEPSDHTLLDAALPLLRKQAAEVYTDTQLLEGSALFDGVEWAAGRAYAAMEVFFHEGQLYQAMQAHTSQAHQPPGSTGMQAIYRPIVPGHAGTLEDPIPFVVDMDVDAGLYYSYAGVVYLAKGDMKPCHEGWIPGTPGVHQWEVAG